MTLRLSQFYFTIFDNRVIFGGQTDQPRTPEQEWYYKRVSFWMKRCLLGNIFQLLSNV